MVPDIWKVAGTVAVAALGIYWFYRRRCGIKEKKGPVIVEKRDYTLEELSKFNGADGAPILIAVKGVIYDCTSSSDFYGPGGPYRNFAGKDATRALALMSTKESDTNVPYADLAEENMDVLNQWIELYERKYKIIGNVMKSGS
eukprot:Rmarinus@m.9109